MNEILVMWPIITVAGFVVFGAGCLVEKMRNGKFVRQDLCASYRKGQDDKLATIKGDVAEIKQDVKSLLEKAILHYGGSK